MLCMGSRINKAVDELSKVANSAAAALDNIRLGRTGVDITDLQKLIDALQIFADAFERDPTLLVVYHRAFGAWNGNQLTRVPQLVRQLKSVRWRLEKTVGRYRRGVLAPDAPRLRDFCVKLSKQAQAQRVIG